MQRPALLDELPLMPESLVFDYGYSQIVAATSQHLSPGPAPEAVPATLSRLGLRDADLEAFYRFCDGGELLHVQPHDPEGRGLFLPSVRIYPLQDLEVQTDVFRAWFEFVEEADRPPSFSGIAIGEATETGNFFVALPDSSSVAIYFFDHDDPTPNYTPVAHSFREFLHLLVTPPFTPLLLVSGCKNVRAAP